MLDTINNDLISQWKALIKSYKTRGGVVPTTNDGLSQFVKTLILHRPPNDRDNMTGANGIGTATFYKVTSQFVLSSYYDDHVKKGSDPVFHSTKYIG